jgi:hypothetical protein
MIQTTLADRKTLLKMLGEGGQIELEQQTLLR